MKKLFCIIMVFFLYACSTYHLPMDVADNAILENYQVIYSPQGNFWSNGGMVDDRIVFTKHISSGSGGYSEYTVNGKTFQLPTTYEFLDDNRLIGYNQHNLKFYNIIYQKGILKANPMPESEVAELFPGIQIVPLSDAKNNVLMLSKYPFETKSFLLLNDTDADYYRYSFEEFKNLSNDKIKGLITVHSKGRYVFSHFGSRNKLFPILIVKVKYKMW